MSKNHIYTLHQRIRRSSLLTSERKERLLAVLPTLSKAQIDTLEQILQEEQVVLNETTKHVVTKAAKEQNIAFFNEIQTLIAASKNTLRSGQENIEVKQEKKRIEHMFDDIQ